MNRAAEKAAPAAKEIFLDAIGEMTIDDSRKILAGSDTAATEYFQEKTSDKLAAAFKPTVSSSMNDVGVTKKYKDLVGKYQSVPFASQINLDIDDYVTGKAVDGLFVVVGEQEKKIRTVPTARVNDLLKEVFNK
jgi:enolase